MGDFLDYQFANLGIADWMQEEGVTEICINRPGELFVERHGRWSRHANAHMTFERLRNFCVTVVNESRTGQRITEKEPMVSLTFPSGQRAQLIIPPACEADTVSITLRIPGRTARSLTQYAAEGYFSELGKPGGLAQLNAELRELRKEGRWVEFFERCVTSKRNIVVAGATGSGKTSFMRALVRMIPDQERLITIEDARELFLGQPNVVHLLYSKGDQGVAPVSARQCMEASLRMKPDRILLAELRGDESFYFLRNCASGHPGAITSVHAGSTEQAWHQLALMVKGSPEGAGLDFTTIHRILRQSVDVMVHLHAHEGRRCMSGVTLTADLED